MFLIMEQSMINVLEEVKGKKYEAAEFEEELFTK